MMNMPSTDFWAGVLALPLTLIALAAVAAAFFGAWKVFESWADKRYTRLKKVGMPAKMPFGDTWTVPNLGGREAMAALTLTSRYVALFRITGNAGIIIVRGKPGEGTEDVAVLTRAIPRAVSDLTKEIHDEAQNAH